MNNNEDYKNRRTYIHEDELFLEPKTEDTHSLTHEEVQKKLEKQKQRLLEQMAALHGGSGGNQDLDNEETLRQGR